MIKYNASNIKSFVLFVYFRKSRLLHSLRQLIIKEKYDALFKPVECLNRYVS